MPTYKHTPYGLSLAPFAILAALGLTACPADDDDDPTNATTVATLSTTNGESTGPSESSGNADTTVTASTTTPAESSGDEAPAESSSSGGSECLETDECQEDTDCVGGATCISCICVGGAESGGDCAPGACDACADINMCVACTQMMGGECMEANAACNMVPECGMLIQCANMCTDPMTQQACLMECNTMYPDGVDGFNALQACLIDTCT